MLFKEGDTMLTRTEYPNVFKIWDSCDIRDTNGRLLKSVDSKEEAEEFIRNHFYGDKLFPCDIRVEFNGCVGYRFENK